MRLRTIVGLLGAALLLAGAALALPAGAQDGTAKTVLRIGWASDPQSLNPFVAQDEENYNIWAINWDLLVGFSPEDLSPAPGIAETWKISKDKKTVTFKLVSGAKWSDGRPITSKDVKYSLETLGGNGLLFSGYTQNVTSIETPDATTVVIKTKRPDVRIVGGLFIYMLPEHVWGKVPLKKLKGSYQPELPLVGSGPFVVTEFSRGRILRMERNPNFRGPKPKYDEIHFIKFGNTDAVERALRLGEVDAVLEAQKSTFDKLAKTKDVEAVRSPTPGFTQLAFNLCPPDICPDAKFNPAVQDRAVRQAVGYAVDRERVNQIATRGTAFPAHGLLSESYESFYEQPAQDYEFDPDRANQLLDEAGYKRAGDGVRAKGDVTLSFDLFVRSEEPSDIQAAKLVAEMSRAVGIEFKVQVISVDRLTEITTMFKDDKPAPDFDTFIWGWSGDPYDPSFLLSLLTTDQIGTSSDAFYSNPEYDRLFLDQAGEFDIDKRKALVQRMIEIAQRDLPYLVLVTDPTLEAYRTDRIENVELACPRDGGNIMCAQTGYEPLLTLAPAASAAGATRSGNGLLALLLALSIGANALLLVRLRRKGGGSEPLEYEL